MHSTPSSRRQFTLLQLMAALTAVAVVLGIATPWLRRMDPLFASLLISTSAWFIVVGLIVGLGVLPLRSQHTKAAARAEALAHGIGALGVLVLALVCVPAFVNVFREYDVWLARPACLVLQGAEAAARHWYLAMPCVIFSVALDAGVFSVFHSRLVTRWLAKTWSAIITMALLSPVLFAAWALTREFFAWGGLGHTHYLF